MAILGWKIGLLDVHLLVGYWKMGGWPGGEFSNTQCLTYCMRRRGLSQLF